MLPWPRSLFLIWSSAWKPDLTVAGGRRSMNWGKLMYLFANRFGFGFGPKREAPSILQGIWKPSTSAMVGTMSIVRTGLSVILPRLWPGSLTKSGTWRIAPESIGSAGWPSRRRE